MKIKDIAEPNGFFEAVNNCEGKVELYTAEGDCLNLKSKLCQYIALTQMFQDDRIDTVELAISNPKDLAMLLPYLIVE